MALFFEAERSVCGTTGRIFQDDLGTEGSGYDAEALGEGIRYEGGCEYYVEEVLSDGDSFTADGTIIYFHSNAYSRARGVFYESAARL